MDKTRNMLGEMKLRGIHDKGYMIRIPIHYQEKQYQNRFEQSS